MSGRDPAFPTDIETKDLPDGSVLKLYTGNGLTKREWFAGMAMHDHIQRNGYLFPVNEIRRRAYELADAMLAEG